MGVPKRRLVDRRQDADDGHAGGEPSFDSAGSILEHETVCGIDSEERRGAQVAGRIGLAGNDVVGRDEDVRDGEPGGAEACLGERARTGGDDREAAGRDRLGELACARQGA